MPPELKHIPVMPDEVRRVLSPAVGEVYVDLTLGGGGHAELIVSHLGSSGLIIGCDLDPANLDMTMRRLDGRIIEKGELTTSLVESLRGEQRANASDWPVVVGVCANFCEVPQLLNNAGLSADMVLADLGFSSTQMADPNRGFSFQSDGPLDMRLNPSQTLTAAMLVNGASEAELADLIYRYGDERASRKIASAIIAQRGRNPIRTTAQLADVVRSVVKKRPRKRSAGAVRIDPATKTFQALRIAVNDEIGNLESLCASILAETKKPTKVNHSHATPNDQDDQTDTRWLSNTARVALISFHSLEDREVKRTITALVDRGAADPITIDHPLNETENTKETSKKTGRSIPGPMIPTEQEQRRNPRSRSARLRAFRLVPR